MFLSRFLLATLLLHPGSILLGNDGAAEVALGGIRLKQERRIAMVKERLYISKKKVRVDYEFRNDSDKEIATEIAFPIPEYSLNPGEGWAPFDDFKVWVDGKEVPYQTEARAFLGRTEITTTLASMHLNIATFGDFQEPNNTKEPERSQISALSLADRSRLVAAGAITTTDDVLARWTVRKTYHWRQKFPAGSVVRISHEYTPMAGDSAGLTLETIEQPQKDHHNETADPGCPDDGFKRTFLRAVDAEHRRNPDGLYAHMNSLPAAWVRYILTTANTWKTPISDFELTVERDPGELVTFCWEGPVEKTGANTFRARMKDFVPTKELTVYFLQP